MIGFVTHGIFEELAFIAGVIFALGLAVGFGVGYWVA